MNFPTVSETLQDVRMPVVDDAICNSLQSRQGLIDPRTQICAGFPDGGVDSCRVKTGFLSSIFFKHLNCLSLKLKTSFKWPKNDQFDKIRIKIQFFLGKARGRKTALQHPLPKYGSYLQFYGYILRVTVEVR